MDAPIAAVLGSAGTIAFLMILAELIPWCG